MQMQQFLLLYGEFGFMIVGLTYDLKSEYLAMGYDKEIVAEFDREDTIDGIEDALKILGKQVVRIGNIKKLVKFLNDGQHLDYVFNICEGLYGFGREAQVPALLEAYNIPYVFSDPLVLSLTLHKGLTKSIIRDAKLPTADFCVVNDETEIENIKLTYPLFAKPVAEGTSKGITPASKIESSQQLEKTIIALLKKFEQPVLVEEYLPGREFTIGIIGAGKEAYSLGAMEVLLKAKADSDVYSFGNKENYEEVVEYKVSEDDLAQHSIELALKVWKLLGCRDAGRVDIRVDKNGIPNFIEVNPLAGLNPTHSDLPILCRLKGISFNELIKKIIYAAENRIFAKK